MPDFRAASEVIREAIPRRVFPGAVVEVGSPTRPVWQAAFGIADLRPPPRPSGRGGRTPIYDLASLTKVLATATVAMRAVEQGALALDDAVADARARSGPAATGTASPSAICCRTARACPAHRPLLSQDVRGRRRVRAAICAAAAGVSRRGAARSTAISASSCWRASSGAAGRSSDRFAAFWARSAPARSCSSGRRRSGGARTAPDRVRPVARAAARGRGARRELLRAGRRRRATPGCSARRQPSARLRGTCSRCSMAAPAAFSHASIARASRPAARDVPGSSRALGGTRCCRRRRAARGCRPARSATPGSPAPACGSIRSAAATWCC